MVAREGNGRVFLVAFFSGVVEERYDTPERVRKQTLVEAREARFLFFNETGTF